MELMRTAAHAVLAFFALALAAHAETPTLLAVQARQAGVSRNATTTAAATVSLVSEGGFRWARTERVSITEQSGRYEITIERIPYDGTPQGPVTSALTKAQYEGLVEVLTRNDALSLKDDQSKQGQVRDASDYTVRVTLAGKTNAFHVFAPMLLHDGHTHVVDAIEALAYTALPAPNN